MPQCIHDAYKRTYLSNTIKMKLLIILLTLCNGLIKPSQQGQIDCCKVLVTSLGGSAEVPAACKNMLRICRTASSISANKRVTENLDLLKPENDHEPQGEESIITTVSEVWKRRTDTTFSTSTYTTTGSTTVSQTLTTTTTTTNTWLKNTPSGFMERKSTSFYTYFWCQESLLNHMLPSEICMFHRGQEDFCCVCNI